MLEVKHDPECKGCKYDYDAKTEYEFNQQLAHCLVCNRCYQENSEARETTPDNYQSK